jgi:hypothetical protein
MTQEIKNFLCGLAIEMFIHSQVLWLNLAQNPIIFIFEVILSATIIAYLTVITGDIWWQGQALPWGVVGAWSGLGVFFALRVQADNTMFSMVDRITARI